MKSAIIYIILLMGVYVNAQGQVDWSVDANNYQYSMTITGKLSDNITVGSEDKIGVFYEDECRGVVSPKFEDDISEWVVYLIAYSDTTEETLYIKYYNAEKDSVINIDNTISFEIDAAVGNYESLYVFNVTVTGISDNILDRLNVYPVPASTDLYINNREILTISVVDMSGKQIAEKVGSNISFNVSGWTAGMYFLQVRTDKMVFTKKIIKVDN